MQQRRRSIPHTFEAHCSREGPPRGASRQIETGSSEGPATRKDQPATNCGSHKRVANLSQAGLAHVNEYRAYTVGGDGHITASRAFKCVDDSEAIVWAKQLVDGHDIELWSGDRFVIRLEHQEER